MLHPTGRQRLRSVCMTSHDRCHIKVKVKVDAEV